MGARSQDVAAAGLRAGEIRLSLTNDMHTTTTTSSSSLTDPVLGRVTFMISIAGFYRLNVLPVNNQQSNSL